MKPKKIFKKLVKSSNFLKNFLKFSANFYSFYSFKKLIHALPTKLSTIFANNFNIINGCLIVFYN